MSSRLDDALKGLSPPRPAGLDALRQAMAVEKPEGSPRQDALTLAAVLLGLVAASGAALLLADATDAGHLAARAWVVTLVAAAGLLATVLAARPRASMRWLGGAAVLAAAALLVTTRPLEAPATAPGWVCTASHLGLDLVPLGVVAWWLRRAAFGPWRAGLAGAAAGAAGAMLGELACAQSAVHVAVFHLPAWLASVALGFVLQRVVRPRSFAP